MTNQKAIDINEIFLQGHKKSVELAINISIRTGVPLVVSKNGKIVKIKPKFKYIPSTDQNSCKKIILQLKQVK